MGLLSRLNLEEKKPMQVLCLLLYLAALSYSIYMSAESIARSFSTFNLFSAGVLAFILLVLAAVGLNGVKRTLHSDDDNKGVRLLGFIVLCLLPLFGSIATNTHSFYYGSIIEELQNEELQELKNRLEVIEEKAVGELLQGRNQLEGKVNAQIENLKNQITNEGNKGHGAKTDSIITVIERLLGEELSPLQPSGTSTAALRSHANQYSGMIRGILAQKLASVDSSITVIRKSVHTEEYEKYKAQLDEYIPMPKRPEAETTILLRDGFAFYNKLHELVEDILRQATFLNKKEDIKLDVEPLPKSPMSLRFRRITTSWEQFVNDEYNATVFGFSLFFALILDIAGLAFWAVWLGNDEDSF